MQRLAQDDDGPVAARRDEHHVARLRLAAPRGVDARARLREPRLDLLRGLVVAERGEEVDLRRALHQLEEGDAATAAGKDVQVFEVRDAALARQRRHAAHRDVLDMPDDCDPHRRMLAFRR